MFPIPIGISPIPIGMFPILIGMSPIPIGKTPIPIGTKVFQNISQFIFAQDGIFVIMILFLIIN